MSAQNTVAEEEEDSSAESLADQIVESQQFSQKFPLSTKIGAVLFVSSRPLTAKKIALILEREVLTVEKALAELVNLYDDEIHGFSLQEIAGKWQLRTASALSPIIRKVQPPKARRLSKAAAETLAVIAYKQPVNRADIESIRGVDALPTLKTLLEAKFIRVVGKEDSIGNPDLFATTETFLEKFGLRDLAELPSLTELEHLEQDPGEAFPEEHTKNQVAEEPN